MTTTFLPCFKPTDGRRDALELDVCTADERPIAAAIWNDLEQRLENDSLTCSWDWTRCWLDHYGEGTPHWFLVARRSSQVCGVCLIVRGVEQFDGPFKLLTLHVGTAGEPEADSVCVEHNRLLVEDAWRDEFVTAVVNWVDRQEDWDEFRVDGLVTADAAPFLDHPGFDIARRSPSRYFDLQSAREDGVEAVSRLGYSTRKNVRKNFKAYGELQTEWAETVEQAESIFDDLVRLHQARWIAEGEPGSYASETFTAFHRELIRRLLPSGKVGLFRVRCGGDVVGCVQVFLDRNRALVYQGGSAPYEGKRSPGLVTDFLCIEECLRRGYDAYDFLAGDSHHKQKLTTGADEMFWLVRRRDRWKYRALRAARYLKTKFRRQGD